MNLAHALLHAQTLGIERLDAQLLLLYTLGKPNHRAWLLAHDTDPLAPSQAQVFFSLCTRRTQGEPLAYIVGEKEFFGLTLHVSSAVLVPRPDTEILVEWALECGDAIEASQAPNTSLRVMDLGTGSGAIALAIKASRPHWHVSGLDVSAAALEVAQNNGHRLNLSVDWQLGNWLSNIMPSHGPAATMPFDVIVANPPYIAPNDPHLPALCAEPIGALVAQQHGMLDLTTIIQQAPAHLATGGYLLMEHGYDQALAVRTLLNQSDWTRVTSRRDLAGIERCTGAIPPHNQ